MQETCGQCRQPFSSQCHAHKDCSVHQSQCFSCLTCSSITEEEQTLFQQCVICRRLCFPRESYFCLHCGGYLCRFEFIGLDLSEDEIGMACSHKEMREHIYAFMCDFCCSCGRKLKDNDTGNLGLCGLCSRSEHQQEMEENEKNEQAAIKMSLESFKEDSNAVIVQLLNKDLELTKQQLQVSEFTRKAAKTCILNRERDSECPVCYVAYDTLARRPFLVCLQQHLLCEYCVRNLPSLVDCPLCRDPIEKEKVGPSRQRMKTLELQAILQQKYANMLKQFLLHQEPNQEIKSAPPISPVKPQKASTAQKEVQTDPILSSPKKLAQPELPAPTDRKRRPETEALNHGKKKRKY